MHYLITGHTGFKGTWLTAMLLSQGHQVSGISLDPEEPSLFSLTNIGTKLNFDLRIDIRNSDQVLEAVEKIKPDVVMHLAAQPLVRRSYLEPEYTFETNVLGTLNVLSAVSKVDSIQAVLVVTTDKVYRDSNTKIPYKESDPLGGKDPYSASKAAADILTQSWIASVKSATIVIARAGNVVGGGDWSKDRIVPDAISALISGKNLTLRNPQSIRPWQHVLDCLNGYLKLINKVLKGDTKSTWNFGPEEGSIKTVDELVEELYAAWGESASEVVVTNSDPKLVESNYLLLDSTQSRELLDWKDLLSFKDVISWTSDWYKNFNEGTNAHELVEDHVQAFFKLESLN
jgi:CDP-glucose 4,6-dehydratase